VAAQYKGKYISHIRSEGNRLVQAVDELIRISREAGIPAEIYHLKAAGKANWDKLDEVIAKVETARAEGLKITADMYTYTAGATGLDAAMPPWVLDGGYEEAYKRFKDPQTRKKIAKAITTPSQDWENLYLAAGSPDRVLLVDFKSEALKPLTGKTLAEVAKMRGESIPDAIMNLVLEDRSRVGTVYFMMSEDNVRKELRLPWVSFGSDAASMAPEPPLRSHRPTRAPTATSRACWDATFATRRSFLSNRPCIAFPGFRRPTSGWQIVVSFAPACSPMSSSSIRPRLRTARPSRSRTSML
jgi:N-acyl-D-amino-acid deacylase